MIRARKDMILLNIICFAVLVLTPALLSRIRQFVSVVLTLLGNLSYALPKQPKSMQLLNLTFYC